MSTDYTIDNSAPISDSVYNYDPNVFNDAAPETNGLNSASGNDSSILDDIWDPIKNSFNTILPDIAQVYTARSLANIQAAQSQLALSQKLAQSPPYSQAQKYTISIAAIGAVVLLGAAFILMQRRR